MNLHALLPSDGEDARFANADANWRTRMFRAAAGLVVVLGMTAAGATPAMAKDYKAEFSCVGFPQQFSVPPGVTEIEVAATGGAGSGHFDDKPGGPGATVSATLRVNLGDVLTITVGCTPAVNPNRASLDEEFTQRGTGGYGFSRGGNSASGGGGGGSTAVAICDGCLVPALLAAGGGGAGSRDRTASRAGYGGGGDNFGADGSSGVVGGAPGASPIADGISGEEGGGGGGGYPHGGGAGADTGCSFACVNTTAGGGGGGQSYVDLNVASAVRQGVNNKVEDGSVVIKFQGPDGLGVPEPFGCTGRTAIYTPPSAATSLRITVIGANGGREPNTRQGGRWSDPRQGGFGAGMSGIVITQSAITVAVGCPGSPGALSSYGRETAPGGAGGFGIVRGGDGGTGNHSALTDPETTSAFGGAGGGGASGISFVGSLGSVVQLIAAGGGGAGGSGGHAGFAGPNRGGQGGDAGGFFAAGGSAGTIGDGSFGPGAGGALGSYGSGGPGPATGGSSANFIGTACGGGGGGGGGQAIGFGGGGATSGNCLGAGGGGGGGGLSSFVSLGQGLQLVQPFDTSGFRAEFNTIGAVIITPIFD